MALQIAHGSYSGTGTTNSFNCGFAPRVLMFKGGLNAGALWTDTMSANSTAFLMNATANFTDGVTSVSGSTVNLGADTRVNSGATTYYWIALGGPTADLATFTYTGNGTNNRTVSVTVASPTVAYVKRDAANAPFMRTSDMGANNCINLNGAAAPLNTNGIKSMGSSLVTLGTDASANATGGTYHGFALADVAGYFCKYTYTGNGGTLGITGFGFQPEWVLTKQNLNQNLTFRSVEFGAAARMGATGVLANSITSLDADGITLGNSVVLNTNAVDGYGLGFKTTPLITSMPLFHRPWRIWKQRKTA